MISRQMTENTLYFDVETAGQYPTFDKVLEEDPKLAELWIKRCKWLEKNIDTEESKNPADLWKNRASLHPEFGRVICISFGVFTSAREERITSFYGDDEMDILNKANKIFENSRKKGFKIGGLNIKNFDVPYIGKRMLINLITPDPIIQAWNKKPWELPYLDLGETFSFGSWGQSFSSLDLISHVLGVPSSKDNLEGSKVHEYYWEREAVEEIKDYCEKDVICTMKCFDRITDL